MKTVVTLLATDKDGNQITRTYNNVKDTGIMQSGLYVLTNGDGLPIAHIPLGTVLDIAFPDHDTNISIIQPQVKLA